jgi:hypothetical protein
MIVLPETLKIGGYTVSVQHEAHLMNDNEQCGYFSPREMAIAIDPDMCDDLQIGILVHEILEAVKEIYHIDALKTDHHAIEQLGDALYQVMRENPAFVRLFKEEK